MDEVKTYSEYKEDLKIAYDAVINHPGYVNKPYYGMDFCKQFFRLEFSWLDLIFKGTDKVKRYNDKNSFEYKLTKWCHWMHNCNKVIFQIEKRKIDYISLRAVFIDKLLSQTYDFICAESREEESKILDTSYFIDYLHKTYSFAEYIWLTEEQLGIKSDLLPLYAPCDLSKYPRGEKLNRFYRKQLSMLSNEEIKKVISDSKELWKVYKIAVDKGILIDNYGKDIAYE